MKKEKEKEQARVLGNGLPISTKQSIEICSYIRGRKVNKAISILKRVLDKKEAIPFKRFNGDVGHKKGIAAGRYPLKASEHFIRLLESAKANAQAKGLDTESLRIVRLCANKGSRPWRYGRQRRRKAKRTNIKLVVQEFIEEDKKSEPKKEGKENKNKEKGSKKEKEDNKEKKQDVKKDKPQEKNKEVKKQEEKKND